MPPTLGQLNIVFGNFISVVLGLIGVVSVLMLLAGGFKFLSAGSDKEGASKARGTITMAIIGIILSISAWMIINLAGRFLGVDLSTFSICLPGQTC